MRSQLFSYSLFTLSPLLKKKGYKLFFEQPNNYWLISLLVDISWVGKNTGEKLRWKIIHHK